MKLAFITPRYGGEIGTGPEHACRLLAERLCARHDIHVLTTCASGSHAWRNDLSEGVDRIRGVLVQRFAVTEPRGNDGAAARLLAAPHTRGDELAWVRRAGPWSEGLIEHLGRQHRSYDALVFFSLWPPTTVHGLQAAPERSILFPYLELRPELRFGLWADVIASARAVGYVSHAERRLLHGYVGFTPRHEEVVGIGIDPAQQQTYPRHQQNPADAAVSDDETAAGADDGEDEDPGYLTGRGVLFRRRHRLYGRFALYAGRVEPDNGSEELLEYFHSYAGEAAGEADADEADAQELALVLAGIKMMKVPPGRRVRLAGVLPDRERMSAFEAAELSLAPAPGDLLSESLLESLAVGTPVLASARNETAVEHCRRANAGLYYANGEEFVETLRLLTTNTRLRQRLGENGRRYVRQHYRWDVVLGRFERLISRVRAR